LLKADSELEKFRFGVKRVFPPNPLTLEVFVKVFRQALAECVGIVGRSTLASVKGLLCLFAQYFLAAV
jgi:hypothetical protein